MDQNGRLPISLESLREMFCVSDSEKKRIATAEARASEQAQRQAEMWQNMKRQFGAASRESAA